MLWSSRALRLTQRVLSPLAYSFARFGVLPHHREAAVRERQLICKFNQDPSIHTSALVTWFKYDCPDFVKYEGESVSPSGLVVLSFTDPEPEVLIWPDILIDTRLQYERFRALREAVILRANGSLIWN